VPALGFGEAAPLMQERALAQEMLADARLALGQDAVLVAWLQEMAKAAPERERRWEQLMVAQYRAGMQADALASYQMARQVLADDHGIDPGPGLAELHQRILVADPALLWHPDGHAPAAPAPRLRPVTAGRGRQHRSQRPADQRPLAAGGTSDAEATLPAPAAVFAGRRAELQVLDRLAQEAQTSPEPVLAAIVGPAGTGKSALAIHWAQRAAAWFPGGHLYADMRGGSAEAALTGFLCALGTAPQDIPADRDERAGLLADLLRDRRMLIVIDNANGGEEAGWLLAAAGGSMILITGTQDMTALAASSRAHLIGLDVLTRDEARALLAGRLGAARVAREPEAVDELISMCARLPLALAAAAESASLRPGSSIASLVAELSRSHAVTTTDSSHPAVVVLRGETT
jgi:hypothetical protein